jgi:nitrogenase subunit NifH
LVFDTVIHRTVRLAEAPSAGESILTFAPNSKGAAEYTALVEEIITREEGPKEQATVEEARGETREETSEEADEETLAEVGSQDQVNTLD